jgi:hypothetical protein
MSNLEALWTRYGLRSDLSPLHALRQAVIAAILRALSEHAAPFAAFHAAYDAHPYDVMHPCRVEARESLWYAEHPDWICTPLDEWTPF